MQLACNALRPIQDEHARTALFWRIVKGGPGLPLEGAPWETSMPAWEQFLSEEQIWELILALYHDTGQRPWAVVTGVHE